MTIDTHHHILPDFFWQATENAHAPVGGLAPLRWSKEARTSFMDDAGVAGIDQVLYGTDFPYLRRDLAVSSKECILQSSELNDFERGAILGDNASRLFPRKVNAT